MKSNWRGRDNINCNHQVGVKHSICDVTSIFQLPYILKQMHNMHNIYHGWIILIYIWIYMHLNIYVPYCNVYNMNFNIQLQQHPPIRPTTILYNFDGAEGGVVWKFW